MTSATNIVLMLGALLSAFIFFHPKLRKARLWRATVTPLASIIGSGFLVAGPILAHAAGVNAWIAMAALCTVGYLFGAAIRRNIAYVEKDSLADMTNGAALIERASELVLSLAYFISVAYYLNLFAAFGLRFFNTTDQFWIHAARDGGDRVHRRPRRRRRPPGA